MTEEIYYFFDNHNIYINIKVGEEADSGFLFCCVTIDNKTFYEKVKTNNYTVAECVAFKMAFKLLGHKLNNEPSKLY